MNIKFAVTVTAVECCSLALLTVLFNVYFANNTMTIVTKEVHTTKNQLVTQTNQYDTIQLDTLQSLSNCATPFMNKE